MSRFRSLKRSLLPTVAVLYATMLTLLYYSKKRNVITLTTGADAEFCQRENERGRRNGDEVFLVHLEGGYRYTRVYECARI